MPLMTPWTASVCAPRLFQRDTEDGGKLNVGCGRVAMDLCGYEEVRGANCRKREGVSRTRGARGRCIDVRSWLSLMRYPLWPLL
jgi:hypothetical protein